MKKLFPVALTVALLNGYAVLTTAGEEAVGKNAAPGSAVPAVAKIADSNAAGVNLLQNSDFEVWGSRGVAYWMAKNWTTGETAKLEAETMPDGKKAVKIMGKGSNLLMVYAGVINKSPQAQKYVLKFKHKTANGIKTFATVQILKGTVRVSSVSSPAQTGSGELQELTYPFDAAEGTDNLKVLLRTDGEGTVFTKVSLEEVK